MRTVSQQDVSGKVVVRVAHYNFATDDASPDAIVVEKYASELGSSAVYAMGGGTVLRIWMVESSFLAVQCTVRDSAKTAVPVHTYILIHTYIYIDEAY